MSGEVRDVGFMIVWNLEGTALFTKRGVKTDHHRVQYLVYFFAMIIANVAYM